MHKFTSRFSPFVVAAVLALVATRNAQAVDVFWDNAGTGDWDIDANWLPALQPATGDSARIENGGTAQVNTDESANGLLQVLVNGGSTVDIGLTGILNHAGAGGNDVKIGNVGVGTLNMNGGTFNTNTAGGSWTFVGVNGGTGTLGMNGGTLNVAGERFIVGQGGGSTGTVTQIGGDVIAGNQMRIGSDGGAGVYNVDGGNVTVLGGSIGEGTLAIGRDGGHGILNITDGSLNVSAASGGGNGRTTVGWGSPADNQINHTGGTANFNELWVGSNGGNGTLNTIGNGFNVGTFATGQGGGTGVTNQTGGSIDAQGEVHVGADGGSHGTYNLGIGAALSNSGGQFVVGRNGATGIFNSLGGTVQINGEFNAGRDGGTGTFNNDGGIVNSNGEFMVGRGGGGNGIFNNNAGIVNVTAGNLHIGREGGTGLFENNPGGLVTTNNEFNVGWNTGSGIFNNHAGATVNANLNGGSSFNVGRDNATGTFVNDGTVTTNSQVNIGWAGGGNGTFINNVGATLDSTNGNIHVGRDTGTGKFLNDGTFSSTNDIYIGVGTFAKGEFTNNGLVTETAGWTRVGAGGGAGPAGAEGNFVNNPGASFIQADVTSGSKQWLNVGENAKGVLTQNGGNITAGITMIGRDGGVALYDHIGGDASFAELWAGHGVGGTGTTGIGVINTPGTNGLYGTNLTITDRLGLGRDGGEGTLNQASGGEVSVVNQVYIAQGLGSKGTYNLGDSDGPATLTAGLGLIMGDNGGDGTLNMTPGSIVNLTGGETFIGWGAGKAVVNMEAGGLFNVNGYVNIGREGDYGIFNNNGGTFINNQELRVGMWGGTGVFNNEAGSGDVTTRDLRVGMGLNSRGRGDGTFNLRGATNVMATGGGGDGWVSVGRDGGVGVFNHDSTGTVSSTGMQIGRGRGDGGQGGGDGVYNFNAGNIILTGSGDDTFNVGRDSNSPVHSGGGLFTMRDDAQTLQVNGRTVVGWNGEGTIDQQVGTANLTNVWIGRGQDSGVGNGLYKISGTSVLNLTDFMALGSGNTGGGHGELEINDFASVTSSNRLGVGVEPGGIGTLTQNGGTLTVAGSLNFGEQRNAFAGRSIGHFNKTDGVTIIGGEIDLGQTGDGDGFQLAGITTGRVFRVGRDGGVGKFDMQGGSITTRDEFWVGVNGGASGEFNMSGGIVLSERQDFHVGTGGGATGVVNQSGGTIEVNGLADSWANVGRDGGTGTYNLSGGTFIPHRRLVIGRGGGSTGIFEQTGGEVLFGDLRNGAQDDTLMIGQEGGNGTYTISGGQLTQMDVPGQNNEDGWNRIGQGGGTANFNLSGTGVVTLRGRTHLGTGGDATGTITQTGGSFTVLGALPDGDGGQGELILGEDGNAHYNISGGTLTTGTNLYVGHWDNSQATMSISEPGATQTVVNVGGAFGVGRRNPIGNPLTTGVVTQSGGDVFVNGELEIGIGEGGETNVQGDYTLSGGNLNVAGVTRIGERGVAVGHFVQTGGTFTAGDGVRLGRESASVGTYAISGGLLNSVGGIEVGEGSTSLATFTQTGGTVKVGGITAAPPAPANSGVVIGLNAGSNGSYALSGGELDLDGHDLLINPSGIAASASFTMTGGTLRGVNEINTDLTNTNGTVAPGGTGTLTGTMFVRGTYEQVAGSTLQIQLGGTTAGVPAGPGNVPPVVPGQYDILQAQDFALLDGTMAVSLVGGFQPNTGDFFQVVQAGSGTLGTNFAAITGTDLSAIGGPGYRLNRITDGLNVGLLAALPGDANLDQSSDFTDLGLLLNNYNQSVPGGLGEWGRGDFNDDHFVDFTDLGILLNNYNQSVTLSTGISPLSANAGAVPEPSSWALLALGGLALGARRLRGRRRRS